MWTTSRRASRRKGETLRVHTWWIGRKPYYRAYLRPGMTLWHEPVLMDGKRWVASVDIHDGHPFWDCLDERNAT